jgi:TonB family protein
LAGAAWHAGLLTVGLVRLRGLRRRAVDVGAVGPRVSRLNALLGTDADVRLSDEVQGPVTFGLRRATVLLPLSTRDMTSDTVDAVLCHELLHVKRWDWLWTVAEAAWASLLWFHPAARYLVSRSSLARELMVDAQTLAITRDRRAYAQALLTFAGTSTQPATVATPFFTRRHLPDRVAFIVNQEVGMQPRGRFAVTSAALTVLALAVTLVIRAMPMLSAAGHDDTVVGVDAVRSTEPVSQASRPGNGTTVPTVVHQEKPQYTAEALAAKIQGDVIVDVVVLENGTVGEVSVVKSLDTVHGLDNAAVSTVKRWRFEPGTRDGKPVSVTVAIAMTFTLKD